MEVSAEIVSIISAEASSSAILEALYHHRKALDRKVSLAFLCREAGISSKGYLGDVMRGRRSLKVAYCLPLLKALRITGLPARLVALRLRLEQEADPSRQERLVAQARRIEKALKITRQELPHQLSALAFEVFCALGLFRSRATLDQLKGYFTRSTSLELEVALRQLMHYGYVRRANSYYEPTERQVTFSRDPRDLSHINFLQQSIEAAKRDVAEWYDDPRTSHFGSLLISVRQTQYEALLTRLKDEIRLWHADLETDDGDMIVRFNVQLYPVR